MDGGRTAGSACHAEDRLCGERRTVAQWLTLEEHLRRNAMSAGFASEEWAPRCIAQVIRRHFGVTCEERYLERPRKAHGFEVQRPIPRARTRRPCDAGVATARLVGNLAPVALLV